jgi:hypothetical protein
MKPESAEQYVDRMIRENSPGQNSIELAVPSAPWMSGDRLECIDDTGWLIPDPGFEHLSPRMGEIYTLREYTIAGGVGAVTLMEGHPDNAYRACRFRPVR